MWTVICKGVGKLQFAATSCKAHEVNTIELL